MATPAAAAAAERTKQLSDVPAIGNTAVPQSDAPNAAAQQSDAPNAAAQQPLVGSLTASPPGAALQPNAEAPRADAHSTGAPQPDRSDTVAPPSLAGTSKLLQLAEDQADPHAEDQPTQGQLVFSMDAAEDAAADMLLCHNANHFLIPCHLSPCRIQVLNDFHDFNLIY